MKKGTQFKKLPALACSRFGIYFILLGCLLYGNRANAHFFYKAHKPDVAENIAADTEKRVDYIEKIYFSGKNKDDLYNMILITVQTLEQQPATKAVAKQYIFLSGIEDQVNNADNSCQVEEILAAGIYGIDAYEALQQNIPKPSAQTSDMVNNAMASVSNLTNSTNNLNASVFTLRAGTFNSYSSYSAFNKVSGATSAVGGAVNTIGSTKKMADDVGSTLKAFGLHKDKPCKNVPQKYIQIGTHLLPDTSKHLNAAAGTKIIIKNISYGQISAVASVIQGIDGVSSVNSDDFNNNAATMLVVNNMSLKELINKILQSNKGFTFNVESVSASVATLSIK